jgi:hypothetical protein
MICRAARRLGAASVLALAALTSRTSSVCADEPKRKEAVEVFVQPVGTLVFAAGGGGLYLPLGLAVPIDRTADLVVELTPVAASWYGCGSTSYGGWAAAGIAWFAREHAHERGFFAQPKLIARYFNTSGARDCSGRNGIDYELGWRF